MRRLITLIVLLVTLFCCQVVAFPLSDTTIFTDTSRVISRLAPDTIVVSPQERSSNEFHSTKSPLLAMGLSALLPGVGQIYDGSYWKAPVIWGIGGYWLYVWIDLNNQYKDFQRLYNLTGNSQYMSLRNFYRDERDKYAWFMGALYLLNIVDAYAGAHLYDFNVSPDLSVGAVVSPHGTVALRIKF